jgi:Rap1a immunity proteins
MRTHALTLVVIMIFCPRIAYCEPPHFWTGEDLLRVCGTANTNSIACMAYVGGALDALTDVGRACFPGNGWTVPKLTDVIVDYFKNHPEVRKQTAGHVVTEMVVTLFACGSRR